MAQNQETTTGGNAITNAEGKATYTMQSFPTAGAKTVEIIEQNGGMSITVPVTVVNITQMDLSLSEEVVTENKTTNIIAKPYSNGSPVPNILVHINGEDYVTNSNGEASHPFIGTGGGMVSVNANCGNRSSSVSICDALQYFSMEKSREFNFSYYTRNSLSVTRKFKGLELAASVNSDGSFYLTISELLENAVLEFDVVSYASNPSAQIHHDRVVVNEQEVVGNYLADKPHIKVECRNGTEKLYVNNSVVATRTNYNFFPVITVGGGTILTIDNIKMYKG